MLLEIPLLSPSFISLNLLQKKWRPLRGVEFTIEIELFDHCALFAKAHSIYTAIALLSTSKLLSTTATVTAPASSGHLLDSPKRTNMSKLAIY